MNLIDSKQSIERGRDSFLDRFHCALHSLSPIARRVTIPQLERLMLAGRSATRDRGAAGRAAGESDIGLDGGISSAVEYLPAPDIYDCGHSEVQLLVVDRASAGNAIGSF